MCQVKTPDTAQDVLLKCFLICCNLCKCFFNVGHKQGVDKYNTMIPNHLFFSFLPRDHTEQRQGVKNNDKNLP